MTRAVTFEGKQYTFPDDATDAEISQALTSMHPAPSQAPQPQPPSEYQRAFQREQAMYSQGRGASGPLSGVLEGLGNLGPQALHNLGIGDELAGGEAYLAQGARNLVRRAIGQPIDIHAGVAAQAAADAEKQRGAQFAQQHPGFDAAATAAGVAGAAGSPSVVAAPMSALRAGLTAMGVNAPFAIARQEGSLPQRLPGALQEEAAVGVLGGGLQGLANAVVPRVGGALPRVAARANQFEQAGVRPTLAAVSGGAASGGATKMIGENFLAGAGVRARLQTSLNDAAEASRNLAARFGQHEQPEQTGEALQAGVRRFASGADAPMSGRSPYATPTREWSFAAKANAIYDHVFERIAQDEAGHIAGLTGANAQTPNTLATLDQIGSRVQSPGVAELVQSPLLARIRGALENQGALHFQDLRQLRTWIREARADPQLRMNTSEADLARLESALTQDIYTSAEALGGSVAAQNLRRADQFYRAGSQRIQNVLQPFAKASPRGAYDRVIALAREGGRQNSRALQSLRQSLRPDEWRTVAATVVDNLGRVSAGHPDALQPGAFSVEQFVTNYAKLSREGRQALFGGAQTQDLASALDNLAQVAGYQKGIEAMANRSRSGITAQNVGTAAGLLNPSTMVPTAALMGGMAITGEAMTNPAFVRWLVSASRTGASVGGARRQLAALAQIAGRDPAVAPVYAELARRARESIDNPERRQQRQLEATP